MPIIKPSIQIQKGVVIVNSVWLVKHTSDVLLIMGDLETKYAEVASYSRDSDGYVEILLGATQESLHIDEANKDYYTIIKIFNVEKNVQIIAEAERYSLTAAIIELPAVGRNDLLWENLKGDIR